MFLSTITNEQINDLPLTKFMGEIIIVDSEQTMKQAEEVLKNQPFLGIDTETRPAFKKGLFYDMALLQITTDKTALLFRLQEVKISTTILKILEDPKVLKIGAALHDDIKGMRKSLGNFTPKGFVDLQSIAIQWGIVDKSVKKLAAIALLSKVSKAQRLSNWEANTLTPAQQQYAAIDAWVCREIYLTLIKQPKNNANNKT